jgi:prophage endopeptidase
MLWKTVVAHWKAIVFALMFVWVVIAGKVANSYHDKYLQADKDLKLATQTITDMQTRQRDVASLDAKYTQELANAQETINQLERDVATGKRRLQLNATCKGNSTGASSMDDATSPRLTDC